jgi:hypothetical protein
MKLRRNFAKLGIVLGAAFLLARPALAVVNSYNINAFIDLDGNATNDLQYVSPCDTCAFLYMVNGAGFADGYLSGNNVNNWDQQTYSFAAMQSYITNPLGFGWNGTYDPKFVWSTHLEVKLIKLTNGKYYKVRCTAIDQTDRNPITLEIVELTCTDAQAPTVTAPASTKVTQTFCN